MPSGGQRRHAACADLCKMTSRSARIPYVFRTYPYRSAIVACLLSHAARMPHPPAGPSHPAKITAINTRMIAVQTLEETS
jgi:hypothetical protein